MTIRALSVGQTRELWYLHLVIIYVRVNLVGDTVRLRIVQYVELRSIPECASIIRGVCRIDVL